MYTISSPAFGWAGVTVLLISRSVAQSLKRKLAMLDCRKPPAAVESPVYQNVQSSTGSTVIVV